MARVHAPHIADAPDVATVPARHPFGRQTCPGPSAIVTHDWPSGQPAPLGQGISQDVNLGPDAPAMP